MGTSTANPTLYRPTSCDVGLVEGRWITMEGKMTKAEWIEAKLLHSVDEYLIKYPDATECEIAGQVVGVLLSELPFRFSKDYRWEATPVHAKIYQAVSTIGANLLADNLECVDVELGMTH